MLNLTNEWDKVSLKNEKVNHSSLAFNLFMTHNKNLLKVVSIYHSKNGKSQVV